jgi:hypothetical protein
MKLARLLSMLAGTATIATGLLAVPGPALAADDAHAPRLRVPPRASFVEGTTIGPMALDADGYASQTEGITMRASWVDAPEVCRNQARAVYAGTEPDGWTPVASPMTVSGLTDYSDQYGGGALKLEGFEVQAHDCAGHSTRRISWFKPVVYQQDGTSFFYGDLRTRYAGTWRTSTKDYWSGGTAKSTRVRGARVTFRVRAEAAHQPVALVMQTARNRGRARVMVDGTVVDTIDTRSSARHHRRVVWAGELPSAGRHTVRVVNLGTRGRPRIDVDAFLVSS